VTPVEKSHLRSKSLNEQNGINQRIFSTGTPVSSTVNAYLLALLRKVRFMARYTLPAPIAIDKNIRKATLQRRFSVITSYYSQPRGIREIAIHVCMQVRQFDCRLHAATIRGTRQHCRPVDQRACKVSLFEFICQNAPAWLAALSSC
jgi:hypothetical protein